MKKYLWIALFSLFILAIAGCKGTDEEPLKEDTASGITTKDEVDEMIEEDKELEKDESNGVMDVDDPEGIYGHLEGATYMNDYFGVSIEMPEGGDWLPQEALEAMIDVGSSISEGEDLSKELDTYILFGYFGQPIEAGAEFKMNIIGTAEKKLDGSVIESNHEMIVKSMEASGVEVYDYIVEFPVFIKGKEFIHLTITINGGLKTLRQDYFIAIIKDYRVVIVETQEEGVASVLMENLDGVKE